MENKTSPFQPGAARWGNFINYYQFNPPANRLRSIPKNFLQELGFNVSEEMVLALDIGCNSGELTWSLYEHFSSEHSPSILADAKTGIRMLAIDLDETLIERCKEQNPHSNCISFECVDFMEEVQRDSLLQSYCESNGKRHFDVAFAFSVTMWIHLNHGDAGLKAFLSYGCSKANCLIVELQNWKCYKSACRRQKRLLQGATFDLETLKMKPDVEAHVEKFVLSCGMIKVKEFHNDSWNRQILVFKRIRNEQ